jgi:hypothetical protein
VIECWDVGFSQMSIGQKAKLFCPSDTAYGPRGAGGVIPPNAGEPQRTDRDPDGFLTLPLSWPIDALSPPADCISIPILPLSKQI